MERDAAVVDQLFIELARARQLDAQRQAMQQDATACDVEVVRLRAALGEARTAAERDTRNLRRLQELFLDCLLRARLPGFSSADAVTIAAPSFFPEVTSPGADGTVVTTFSHLGSGGKKTLFKCCFAVALHRLATELDAPLPAILLIDTAMKNISERENRDQFVGFYSLLYELARSELAGTQFIIVDKEYFPPPPNLDLTVQARLMTPDDDAHPPLIRHYRGH